MKTEIVLARISKAYDVLNRVNLDFKVTSKKIGEHTLADEHLEYLKEGDLLLMDRGYPSYWLIQRILRANCDFCIRLPIKNWSVAKKMTQNNVKEVIEEIKPGYLTRKRCKEDAMSIAPIKCRFISLELDSGEQEVLITSLLDKDKYPYESFKQLYFLRWPVEESYKSDKSRLVIEKFSGKSPLAMMQDIYSKLLLHNIVAALSFNAEITARRNNKNLKHQYQLNWTTALSKVRDVLLYLLTEKDILEILNILTRTLIKNKEVVRPNRKYKRENKRKKRYCFAYCAA